MAAALAILLVSILTPPGAADAQDEQISFPPVGDGRWEGPVYFTGFTSVETQRDDGSFDVTITDVIEDTRIGVEFSTDRNGEITSGVMDVDLTYFAEAVGTAPVHLEPYRVVHANYQTGQLEITGNAERLVASGNLTHEVLTQAEGGIVEEVSGTTVESVEFVLHVYEANCSRVQARLVEASGNSLITTDLAEDSTSESQKFVESLSFRLMAFPADVESGELIIESLNRLTSLEEEIRDSELPTADQLMELVETWMELNVLMANQALCEEPLLGWVPQSERSWLSEVLGGAILEILANEDAYEATDLIDVWYVALGEDALGLTTDSFVAAFDAKLDAAIAEADLVTIIDILVFASANGFADLHAKAQSAIDGGG